MLWLKRRDKIVDAILNDLKAIGYDVDSLEAVGVVGDPPYETNRVLDQWAGRVPPKYTQRLNQARHRVSERTTPPDPQRTLDELVDDFRNHQPLRRRGFSSLWNTGDEIYIKYSDKRFDDIAELAKDSTYGADRQMLVLSLGKSKRPEAVSVLIGLLDDYPVSGHATEALAKLRREESRDDLTKMLSDDREWVRKQARLGLKRLDETQRSGKETRPILRPGDNEELDAEEDQGDV